MDSMDVDNPVQSNGNEPIELMLRPVKPLESGEGLPYAPENWPNPGDIWQWRAGPRINNDGYFLDRYLFPPAHLPGLDTVLCGRKSFRSKLSLQRYIRLAFPEADFLKFFSSFSWKIPSRSGMPQKQQPLVIVESSDEYHTHDNGSVTTVSCKAGNDKCGSLMPPGENGTLPAMPCDICCSEPSFCSDCCCILCCKAISSEYEGYSYIKCDALVFEAHICGHVAHLNCALRSYMAGTVGGRIRLDAEYYCRRCDTKKDLFPHVSKFLEICHRVEYESDVEKILNLGICILRGSQRDNTKELLNCIESAVIKLKYGTSLENLWNNDAPTIWSDLSDNRDANGNDALQSLEDLPPIGPMPFNYHAEMHKLEEEIHEVLKALRKAQEIEYQIAESKLHVQKECLNDLYRKLEKEKSEMSRHVSGTNQNRLMTNVLNRLDQIRKEATKLKDMEEVAKGFGRTPKAILEEYFNLRIEE